MIEVAARLGGGHDAELAKLALGVDLNGLALQAALGETIWSAALHPMPDVGGAIVRFLVPPEGTLEAVEGVDEARAVEGVQDVRIYREPGHAFGPFRARSRPRRRRARDRRRARRSRSNGPTKPHVSYASRSVQKLSSEKRATMLGFQPPAIGDEEIEAVAETLRSGWLTTGPRSAELERRFAEFVEAEHVLAVASGTAALHLALLAVGVGPGDEVITTPITWPATANVIVHAGATPVFADVRDADLNIDPERVAELVTDRTKAIVPVDLAGQPADLDPLIAHGSRSSRTRPTPPRARIAAARSAPSSRRPASPSTRRRTSPPARAG